MFRFSRKSSAAPEVKSSAPPVLDLGGCGHIDVVGSASGVITPKSYPSQVLNGLASNAYVHRCVDLRASACSSVSPVLYDDDGDAMDDKTARASPLGQLIRRPRPGLTWRDLIYGVVTDLSVNGNAYLWIQRDARAPMGIGALVPVPPDTVDPILANDTLDPVRAWTVRRGTSSVAVLPEDMIHLHGTVDPTDRVHGISPLMACAASVESMTEAREWNIQMMRNGAKPSMTLTSDRDVPASVIAEYKRQLSQEYAGAGRAGSIAVFTNGLKPDFSGFSAHDMDYTAGISQSARDIGIALGVPSALLSCADMTYSNMAESRQDFAIHTVRPLLDLIYEQLTISLPADGISRIGYDSQQIDGLSGDETAMITALEGASYLTINEKRARLGYTDYPNGDHIMAGMDKVTLEEALSDPLDQANENLDDPASNS